MNVSKARNRIKLKHPTARTEYLWKRDGLYLFILDGNQVVGVNEKGEVKELGERPAFL